MREVAQVKLVGYKSWDSFQDRNGKTVPAGKKVFVTSVNPDDKRLTGIEAYGIKVIPEFDFKGLKLGDEYEAYYDRYGRLQSLV